MCLVRILAFEGEWGGSVGKLLNFLGVNPVNLAVAYLFESSRVV